MDKKIAFCFLIYDVINQEDKWNDFFNDVDKNKYNIYIHYKNQKELKYFENYKLKECTDTKWGHISIVRAQNLLLKEALKDENTHYIFVSQSCIPVKSFDYVYQFLQINKSYFNISPDSQCFPRCNTLLKYFKKTHIKKSSQWCILNLNHAKKIIDCYSLMGEYFNDIFSPDEIVYITLLHHLLLHNELILTHNESTGSTTASQWKDQKGWKVFSDSVYDKLIPKSYVKICDEEMIHLKNEPCLFARKFPILTLLT